MGLNYLKAAKKLADKSKKNSSGVDTTNKYTTKN